MARRWKVARFRASLMPRSNSSGAAPTLRQTASGTSGCWDDSNPHEEPAAKRKRAVGLHPLSRAFHRVMWRSLTRRVLTEPAATSRPCAPRSPVWQRSGPEVWCGDCDGRPGYLKRSRRVQGIWIVSQRCCSPRAAEAQTGVCRFPCAASLRQEKLNMAITGVTLITFNLFLFPLRDTKPCDLCLSEYLINIWLQ